MWYRFRWQQMAAKMPKVGLRKMVKIRLSKGVILSVLCLWGSLHASYAQYIFVTMGEEQANHLRAYGVAYKLLAQGGTADWLLNYQGGSFLFDHTTRIEQQLIAKGVSHQRINEADKAALFALLADESSNMDVMHLEKAPTIAVYSPKTQQPWDDAVTLVLTYAGIPYEVIFDDEILGDALADYDWLHLHHEDFTGQYGKFYSSSRHTDWYQAQQQEYEASAARHGFGKVSELKLAVAEKIRSYVAGGGFLFAMCSATDTFDIALAARETDICAAVFDGDPMTPNAQQQLDFSQTFAFEGFLLEYNTYVYEYSSIDMVPEERKVQANNDFFTLFKFSAKWDPIPTMLTQNHVHVIKGFMGQTTAFRRQYIKSQVVVMGENKEIGEVRYIHNVYGKGFWTFYGGHDPENYRSYVGDPPTDLNLHPNSPGYRLILNNILFPAAKKKKIKT